jgi:hypothetical protein
MNSGYTPRNFPEFGKTLRRSGFNPQRNVGFARVNFDLRTWNRHMGAIDDPNC